MSIIAESIVTEPVAAPIEVPTEPVKAEVETTEKPILPEEKADEKSDKESPEDTEEIRRKKATWSQLAKESRKVELAKAEIKKEKESWKAEFESEKAKHAEQLKNSEFLQKQVADIKGDFGKLRDIITDDLKINMVEFLEFLVKGETPEYIAKKTKEDVEKRFALEKETRENEAKELTAKQEREVYAKHEQAIDEYLSTNKDEYELIHLNSRESEVFELIKLEYSKSGKVLSIKEAADKVENFLFKRNSSAKKLSKAEQKIEDSKPIEAKDIEPKKPLSSGLKKKTLNNSNTAPSATPNYENNQKVLTGLAGAKLVRRSVS